MKKWMALFCAAGMLAVLAGCGESEKVIQKESTQVTKEATTQSTQEVQENTPTQEETSAKGYVFKQQEVVIEVDAKAAPVVEALGEPVSYFEAASCAFEGLDKMYTYNSFELDTYPVDGEDYVSAVIFKDDSITTAEGVAIGDSRARMEEVYGTESEAQGSMVVYHKDGMKLCFILDGDTITSIEYNTTVLDE